MFNWLKDKDDAVPVGATKWEHLVVDASQTIDEKLNGYGAVGWELVAVSTRKMYFIRPLDA